MLLYGRLITCLSVLSLLVLTSAQVQALDLRTHLDGWYSNAVLNRESVFQEEHHVEKLLQEHSEFHWLPRGKLLDMSQTPYSRVDRTYEAVKGHILPVSVLFIGAAISESEGWMNTYRGNVLQNLLLRVGSTLGDIVTAESSKDLGWRFIVSNFDVLRPYRGKGQDKALYLARRMLAYAPYFYHILPEVLWELGVVKTDKVNIKIEPEYLQERIALSLASANSSQPESAELPFAYIDWKVLPAVPDVFSRKPVQSSYEQALLHLDETCRNNGVSAIRFYGAVENGMAAEAEDLSLYLKLSFNSGAERLVKFPAHFGSGDSAKWWTLALDARALQGVYNDQDQYRIVKAWNYMRGYGQPLLNPLSEAIVSSVPELVKAIAAGNRLEEADIASWRGVEWPYTKVSIDLKAENKLNLVAETFPCQSSLHTLISNGESGALFIDDSKSRRVAWPEITLLSHAVFANINTATLVDMERHLPWLPVRGSGNIARQLATDYGYGLLTRAVIDASSHKDGESYMRRRLKATRAIFQVIQSTTETLEGITNDLNN